MISAILQGARRSGSDQRAPRASRRAFTLVELIVVIAVLLILMGIAVPAYLGTRDRSKDTQAQAHVTTAYKNAKAIWADDSAYPPLAALRTLIAGAEPDLSMVTGTPSSGNPREIQISRESDQQITLCAQSQSGTYFCLRANELGALTLAGADGQDGGVPVVLAAATSTSAARSHGPTLESAKCWLPSPGVAPGAAPGCAGSAGDGGGPSWNINDLGVSPVVPTAPELTASPEISGPAEPAVGDELTAGAGEWDGVPAPTFAYQWQRDGNDIPGATDATYLLSGADAFTTITVRVTATNASGSESSVSSGVGPIAGPPAQGSGSSPTVSGTPEVDSELTADPGAWMGDPSFTYAWQRNGGSGWVTISGATGAAYTPTVTDVSAQIRVVVTATNSHGSLTAASPGVGPVIDPLPIDVPNGSFESQLASWTATPQYTGIPGCLAIAHNAGVHGSWSLRFVLPNLECVWSVRSEPFAATGGDITFQGWGQSYYTGAQGYLAVRVKNADNPAIVYTGAEVPRTNTWQSVTIPGAAIPPGTPVIIDIEARKLSTGAGEMNAYVDNFVQHPAP